MENNRSFLICGFTLVELVVVVAIISIIAVVAVGKYSGLVEKARVCAAESDLKAIADAFTNEENGYLRDMRGIPGFSPACLRIGNLLVSTNVYGVAPGGECVRLDLAKVDGCAAPEAFVKWNEEARRGWHGPYVRHASGAFPAAGERRFPDDSTFGSRGFYPPLSGLLVAQDFVNRRVVLEEVPANSTAVGIPARVVRLRTRQDGSADLDQIHIPDPVEQEICRMKCKINELEKKIAEMKMPDLNAANLESAKSMIAGTARSMGILVEE